jgi:serine/threonine-protein kinase HipA
MKKLRVNWQRSPDDSICVGQIAESERRVYFEYDAAFAELGIQLSPFKLPLQGALIEHRDRAFGPLPGLFDDSLPDGWGLLLMDRHFRRLGVAPATVSPIERLAYVGSSTMGALSYHPPQALDVDHQLLDLHALGKNAEAVYAGETQEVLPQLEQAGGSPGGARPKVLVGIKENKIICGQADLPEGFEAWIVKFSSRQDARDAGPLEYAYALMARAAEIQMPPIRLLEVTKTRHYFASKRFDRTAGNGRIHMHTFGNLIHANFRIPSADYSDLFKVTQVLTRNHQDTLELFRRVVFNIVTHNRDDHVKNFAFLMDEEGQWSLSPAYDLSYAPGPGGEHSTTILGEGRAPTRSHCLQLAEQFGIKPRLALSLIGQVNEAVQQWPQYAQKAGCSKKVTQQVRKAICVL